MKAFVCVAAVLKCAIKLSIECIVWPDEPDGFESLVTLPETSNLDLAQYYIFVNGQLLVMVEQGAPRVLTRDEYRWLDLELGAELFMGCVGACPSYAVSASGTIPDGYSVIDLRTWLSQVESSQFYLAGRAQQLLDWFKNHQYCGICGKATENHQQDRARICIPCSEISYPRISPSIIVLVTRGSQVLLARNVRWPGGMFSTLAGFVEVGESIEQTVHREVLEEVGVKVSNLDYRGSQSWPFPNSLMLGFHAEYVSGDIVCQEDEISEADWFDLEKLPTIPPKTAISRWLIDEYRDEFQRNSR